MMSDQLSPDPPTSLDSGTGKEMAHYLFRSQVGRTQNQKACTYLLQYVRNIQKTSMSTSQYRHIKFRFHLSSQVKILPA
jgi:hypothetical protein